MIEHPLKKYRDDHGLTQGELGRLLGVTKGSISRWENGHRAPRRRELPVIAEKTGIAPAELLGFEVKSREVAQ
jgi:transcriptional regulator with XRE-family HTH domain